MIKIKNINLDFWAILILVLQVPVQGKLLIEPCSLHIYGGGNFFLDKDMQKQERFYHFPEETGC